MNPSTPVHQLSPHWAEVIRWAFLIVVLVISFQIYWELRTGVSRGILGRSKRSDNPVSYWLSLSVQLLLLGAMSYEITQLGLPAQLTAVISKL